MKWKRVKQIKRKARIRCIFALIVNIDGNLKEEITKNKIKIMKVLKLLYNCEILVVLCVFNNNNNFL